MSSLRWHWHADCASLADKVAADLANLLNRILAEKQSATIACPGGQSPLPAIRTLATYPIAWDKVHILPTDDRLVPMGHKLSNASKLREAFDGTSAKVLPLITDELHNSRRAGEQADERLHALAWPPDIIWLGMGADGHTASIFPGPHLATISDPKSPMRAVGVLPDPLPPEAPVARVTLSLSAIRSCSHLLLTISGEQKRKTLERALSSSTADPLPIARALLGAPMPVDIHWSPN